MRKLSEILNDLKVLALEYKRVLSLEETEERENKLTDIELAVECLDTLLMYGDYENDTNEEFDYWNY